MHEAICEVPNEVQDLHSLEAEASMLDSKTQSVMCSYDAGES